MTHSIDGLNPLPPLVFIPEVAFPVPADPPDPGAGTPAFDQVLDTMLRDLPGDTLPGGAWETALAPASSLAIPAGAGWDSLYARLVEQALRTPAVRPGQVEQVAAHTPVYEQHSVQAAAGEKSGVIPDADYFNPDALAPEEIDQILREKGSPYAGFLSDEGKTAGQLIWEKAHQAGTVPQGPHTLNPALILAIMGAETGFGKAGWGATNPFNIKLNGSFGTVKTFAESLAIAVNTMYNWAMDRPAASQASFFDYAGNYYCENYQETWKPNVEAFYKEFVGEIEDFPSGSGENG